MRCHIGAGAFAGSGDNFDGVLNEARLRLILIPARKRIEFDRGKPLGNRGFGIVVHRFRRGAASEQVQADFVAAVAAEQFPDGHLKVFAFDVVEGNVDGTDRAAKRCAAKGRHAVEVLPMVFDTQRILSGEVFFEDGNHALDSFGIAPTSRGCQCQRCRCLW